MKIYRSSDFSKGMKYEFDNSEKLKPIDIAYEFGHAENGEIIHIWKDGNDSMFPDYEFYWDTCYRKYKQNK